MFFFLISVMVCEDLVFTKRKNCANYGIYYMFWSTSNFPKEKSSTFECKSSKKKIANTVYLVQLT
jgi:hypothetical protein